MKRLCVMKTEYQGNAEWEVQGRQLLMKWHGPNTLCGMWVDHVHPGENFAGYDGRIQNGISIRGRQTD